MGGVDILILLEALPLEDLGRTCLLKQEQEGYSASLYGILVRQQKHPQTTYRNPIANNNIPVSKDIVLCRAFTSADLRNQVPAR